MRPQATCVRGARSGSLTSLQIHVFFLQVCCCCHRRCDCYCCCCCVCCLLFAFCCLLFAVCCVLCAVCCALCVVLRVVCCALCVVRCASRVVGCWLSVGCLFVCLLDFRGSQPGTVYEKNPQPLELTQNKLHGIQAEPAESLGTQGRQQ